MEERVYKARSLKELVKFNGNIFLLGCGCVGQALLPLLFQLVKFDPAKLRIMDMVDNRDHVVTWLDLGATYVQNQLTAYNYEKILDYLNPGDIFIDCSWDVDTVTMLRYCGKRGLLFVNTSVEEWEPYSDDHKHTTDYTLYSRQMKIRKLMSEPGMKKKPTAILDHGANPGMVSHFVKRALLNIAKSVLKKEKDQERAGRINSYVATSAFNYLARELGVKVIHVSERDTQIIKRPKRPNEFVNTWSIPGYIEEALAPAELGWGTHEKKLPADAVVHEEGNKNQICLRTRGMNTPMRSWIKSGPIIGELIRHGEAFSLSDRLAVYEDVPPVNYKSLPRDRDYRTETLYRPTVHYVYQSCDSAYASLREMAARGKPQKKQRILSSEIVSGVDELGCLLLGDFSNTHGWWIGSLLDIDEARAIIDPMKTNISATSLQIASSLIGAIIYAMKHPTEGICLPDDLDYNEVLDVCVPFLGPMYSGWVSVDMKKVGDMQFDNFRYVDEI